MASPAAASDLVRAYLKEIGRHPLLSQEEELLLARQVQRRQQLLRQPADGDQQLQRERQLQLHQGERARQRMIQANLRLVVAVAKKYQRRGLELLDLVQEGSVGLEKAVERFDPTRGFRFSTYAYWWIRQSITRALACQGRTIRVPVHISEKLNRIRHTQQQLALALGRSASVGEIAAAAGLSEASVRNTLQQLRAPLSLETRVGNEQDTALGDLLVDSHPTPEAQLSRLQLQEAIETLLTQLNPREGEVIRERFGLDNDTPRSLSEIGERLHLSRERVRQIESRALLKLRQPQNRCRLRDYLASLD
ncbi:MAG: sigma-70 family RNA polymerase sigma factor [Cyanobacteria bacterium K_DeepCast_35m_m2_155]|nr:sigma-70 family RNA polymerase sigma factor [Cyanobacteria bacterium K_DeepCast_35m_m2_155]